MAAQHVTLHLEKAQSPGNILTVLDYLARHLDERYASGGELVQAIASNYDYIDKKGEALALARLLGLLDARDFSLTPRGEAVQCWRAGTREDGLHFLLYSGTGVDSDAQAGLRGRAWLYRAACDWLWTAGEGQLTGAGARQLAADLLGGAQAAFPDTALPAISAKSIGGVRAWLAALDPPILHDGRFTRREVCSRELFALALAHHAHAGGAQLGVDLLLDTTMRTAVARLCLIEPATFDRRLDQALSAFPHVLSSGSRAGAYGRFVRLHVFPELETLNA